MKKYLFIGLMAVLATSCEKDPDLSKLDNNFTVTPIMTAKLISMISKLIVCPIVFY